MPTTATATMFPVLHEALMHNRLDTSAKFLAVLGCIAGVVVTDPAIVELCVTSDGWLLGRHEGEIGMNDILGTAGDLVRNVNGLCFVLGIDADERQAILNSVKRWQ